MPVRLLPHTERAERILLQEIVDYAGLFPPAALAMPAAVRNYAHYRASGAGWMLGRFVCAAAALEQFSMHADPFLPRDAGAIPWRLAVTGSGNLAADLRAIAECNARHVVCFDEVGAVVDAFELRAASVDEIEAIDAVVPRSLTTYIEVPLVHDPTPLIAAIARVGRRAKMRAGGITLDVFPSPDLLVRFLAVCAAHNVPAKATAGLHHPLRGTFRLTYDDGAVCGRMYGFVNVFLAAALLAMGGSATDAIQLLEESDAHAFELSEQCIRWHQGDRTHTFDRALLQRTREHVLVSFGSCSFVEPVDESRSLGFL